MTLINFFIRRSYRHGVTYFCTPVAMFHSTDVTDYSVVLAHGSRSRWPLCAIRLVAARPTEPVQGRGICDVSRK